MYDIGRGGEFDCADLDLRFSASSSIGCHNC
jgi:hypothetical protein